MTTAVFTIIAKNYLPFARTLMNSLRDSAPEVLRIVVLVDRTDGYLDPAREDFQVILSEDLEIPESRWFHFKYTILELSTAVKPYAAEYIFDHFRVDRLFYFDPDIHIYSRLDPLIAALDQHSIVLTPHLTAPIDDDRRPADLDILRSGCYNLGFIGLRRCEETTRFLKWWQNKLFDHCVVDLAKGLFVDQRWIDLAPGMFAGVGILRDAGFNVAYWNIAQRRVEHTPEGYMVNGERLCFFHFSGFDPDNPRAFSKHQDRFTLDDLGDGRDLILDYRRQLFENGYAECKKWPYAFGSFANGLPIPDMGRAAHHESPEFASQVSDPYSDEGYRAFVLIWNAVLNGPGGRVTGITRLAYRIYKARTDVQAAMPDIFNGDRVRFLNWVLSSGRAQHSLGDEYIAPIWDALRVHKSAKGASAPSENDPVVNERIIQAVANSGTWARRDSPAGVDALNEIVSEGDDLLALSKLAEAIYASRPDLQRTFPDPARKDAVRFLVWFLTYGAREYRLAGVLVAPLRSQWPLVIGSLDNPFHRFWYRLVLSASSGSMILRERLSAIRMDVRMARASQPAESFTARIAGTVDRHAIPERGVNLIGYVRSEMGVGESVRCAIRAARSCNLPVSIKSVDASGPYRLQDTSITYSDGACPYSVNVFHVNADQSESIVRGLGDRFTQGKYNIGYWAWELEEFPDKWISAFQYFDEIWTPSAFCQTAIARKSPLPVVRIPHAIRVDDCTGIDRASLSIPSDEFVFLGIFDLLSVPERKNPIGLLAAFRMAFGSTPGYRLILKINHAREKPAEMARIREAASGLAVSILDYTMDRNDVNGLIQMSDCLVSLHRSEGFGLTIAEAMYSGKPVVVTGYSGNLDFTKPTNSFLVDYDLVKVPDGCDPYDAGVVWAEPRIDHAASQMRLVAGDFHVRATRAAEGQKYIRECFSAEAVGKLMLERLHAVPFRLLGPCVDSVEGGVAATVGATGEQG